MRPLLFFSHSSFSFSFPDGHLLFYNLHSCWNVFPYGWKARYVDGNSNKIWNPYVRQYGVWWLPLLTQNPLCHSSCTFVVYTVQMCAQYHRYSSRLIPDSLKSLLTLVFHTNFPLFSFCEDNVFLSLDLFRKFCDKLGIRIYARPWDGCQDNEALDLLCTQIIISVKHSNNLLRYTGVMFKQPSLCYPLIQIQVIGFHWRSHISSKEFIQSVFALSQVLVYGVLLTWYFQRLGNRSEQVFLILSLVWILVEWVFEWVLIYPWRVISEVPTSNYRSIFNLFNQLNIIYLSKRNLLSEVPFYPRVSFSTLSLVLSLLFNSWAALFVRT